MTVKLLLDTDIGSDIDDAVCLAYLLAQPQCELLGITTVSGEADKRAMMASAICKVAGKEVPIFPGVEHPLIVPIRQAVAQQAVALPHWEHERHFPRGEAVNFLRETIRKNPGEITLLAIGPLTNLALLFTLDPEIPRLLMSLVMMCGFFGEAVNGYRQLEWNALLDPHATEIVYRSRPPLHRSVGIEITSQVRMIATEVRERFTTPVLRTVQDFAEVWFQSSPVITFHDPLAAATIFDDSICAFAQGKVSVELTEPAQLGETYWRTEQGSNGGHEVAVTVDAPRFFDHYFGTLAGK
ncbi:MAG: nucleoside hydrolase [Anaerolineae bacterium]|nr:nucleoside hydrolase [Anaerolineae bacterium]